MDLLIKKWFNNLSLKLRFQKLTIVSLKTLNTTNVQ